LGLKVQRNIPGAQSFFHFFNRWFPELSEADKKVWSEKSIHAVNAGFNEDGSYKDGQSWCTLMPETPASNRQPEIGDPWAKGKKDKGSTSRKCRHLFATNTVSRD
jgi:hypothetical protein